MLKKTVTSSPRERVLKRPQMFVIAIKYCNLVELNPRLPMTRTHIEFHQNGAYMPDFIAVKHVAT